MAYANTTLRYWALSEPAYAGAVVTFFTVDPVALTATTTLAQIFQDPACTIAAPNPLTLDSSGRTPTSIYYNTLLIASVATGALGTQTTGIITPSLSSADVAAAAASATAAANSATAAQGSASLASTSATGAANSANAAANSAAAAAAQVGAVLIDGNDLGTGQRLAAKLVPIGAIKARITNVPANEAMQLKLALGSEISTTGQTLGVGTITPVNSAGGAIAALNLAPIGAGDTALQDGEQIVVIDSGGAVETNNVTIVGNAGSIIFMGQAAAASIVWNGPNFSMLRFRWKASTSQWIGNGYD